MVSEQQSQWEVYCLCAQWCGTCREYRAAFDSLAEVFPSLSLRWVDIEDEADMLGDLDVENFPTILVRRGPWVLFFGVMLPHIEHLRRLIETFLEQSPQESAQYAYSSPERKGWQNDKSIKRIRGERADNDSF